MRFLAGLILIGIFSSLAHGQIDQYDGIWEGLDESGTVLNIVIETDETCQIEIQEATKKNVPYQGLDCKIEDGAIRFLAPHKKSGQLSKIILSLENDTLRRAELPGSEELSLTYARQTEKKKKIRPQTPKEPFNYHIEEVQFLNERDSIHLAGTFTYPKENEAFPCVVLIAGSGPQNRNSSFFGHQPFWVIADFLSSHGIGVLRYDERGIGKSEGKHQEATTYDLAHDATAAVRYLRSQKDVKNIGVIGHSEGGMIAPIVNQLDTELSHMILLAGPGIAITEIMKLQNKLFVEDKILGKEEYARYDKFLDEAYELIDIETPVTEIYGPLKKLCDDFYDSLSEEDQQKLAPTKMSYYIAMSAGYLQPWFRYFLNYDTQAALKKINCPVLALNGDKDVQVTAKENLAGIQSSLEQSDCPYFEIKELPSLNHLFQKASTGLIDEYDIIEETFNVEVLEMIKDWIFKQAKVKK